MNCMGFRQNNSIKLYHNNRGLINQNKLKIFPFSQQNDLTEECLASIEPSAYRAIHIGDCSDSEGEQKMRTTWMCCIVRTSPTDTSVSRFSTDDPPVTRSNLPTIKILPSAEIRQPVRSLHEEQRKVFDVVANFAHHFVRGSNPTPPLIIVQGEAATGKTKLINSIMHFLSSIIASDGSELDKPKALNVAPTGR